MATPHKNIDYPHMINKLSMINNRLAVLTVKSGLDPHMINKLKDGFKSLSGYFLWKP